MSAHQPQLLEIYSSRAFAQLRYAFLPQLFIAELKGVWLNTGRQQPYSAVRATDNNTIPDCSLDTGLSSYTGLDYGSGQVIACTQNHIYNGREEPRQKVWRDLYFESTENFHDCCKHLRGLKARFVSAKHHPAKLYSLLCFERCLVRI